MLPNHELLIESITLYYNCALIVQNSRKKYYIYLSCILMSNFITHLHITPHNHTDTHFHIRMHTVCEHTNIDTHSHTHKHSLTQTHARSHTPTMHKQSHPQTIHTSIVYTVIC